MELSKDQLKARMMEIEIHMHYSSYVGSMYQFFRNERVAFLDHMNLLLPAKRVSPEMDWNQYWFEMLDRPANPARKKEAILYALQFKKMKYKQMQRVFGISPNMVKTYSQGTLIMLPPNTKWQSQLIQYDPMWQKLKEYGFELW